jgi:hypothetical protein
MLMHKALDCGHAVCFTQCQGVTHLSCNVDGVQSGKEARGDHDTLAIAGPRMGERAPTEYHVSHGKYLRASQSVSRQG